MAAPWDPVWNPNRTVARSPGPADKVRAKFERQFADGQIPMEQFRLMLTKLNPAWTSKEIDGLVAVSRMSNSSADWRQFLDWLLDSRLQKGEIQALRTQNASLRQQVAELSAKLEEATATAEVFDRQLSRVSIQQPHGQRLQSKVVYSSHAETKMNDEAIQEALSKFWNRAHGMDDEVPETRVLHQNFVTGKWTLYVAGGKAKKPVQYEQAERLVPRAADQPTHCAKCPFCVGREDKTPDPLLIFDADGRMLEGEDVPEPIGKWLVRVIPNIFPTLITPPCAYGDAFHRKLQTLSHSTVAGGRHDNSATRALPFEYLTEVEKDSTSHTCAIGYSEVVIEDCIHNALLGISSAGQAAMSLRALQRRGVVLSTSPDVQMLFYFKQYGPLSGGSLVHPHMQICTSPVLTPEFQNRLDRGCNFYKAHGCCSICRNMVAEPTGKGPASALLVAESTHFVATVPFGSGKNHRVTIAPKEHSASWLQVDQGKLEDLAWMLQIVMEGFYYEFDDPSYNFYIFSVDRKSLLERKDVKESAHWTLEILPRFPADLGGLELASGIRCLNGLPADHARELRAAIDARLALRPSNPPYRTCRNQTMS